MSTLITSHEAALQLAKELLNIAVVEQRKHTFSLGDVLPDDFPEELRSKVEMGQELTAIGFYLKLEREPFEATLTHWGLLEHSKCIRDMFEDVMEEISHGSDGVFRLACLLWEHNEEGMAPSSGDKAIH